MSMTNNTIKLGGGLRQDCDAISVMKSGRLRFSKPNKYWVQTSQKRVSITASIQFCFITCFSAICNFGFFVFILTLFLKIWAKYENSPCKKVKMFENNFLINWPNRF
jgi:hypothetical protein